MKIPGYLTGELVAAMEINPAITAADLRNAALVMDTLGLGNGAFVNDQTAAVCMDGAIRLATDCELLRHEADDLWTLSDTYQDSPRRIAATMALAELLPDRCTAVHKNRCPFDLSVPDGRVYHYSDYHCDGTEASSALLVQAAEKLEAEL
jgi:hypothetical protein